MTPNVLMSFQLLWGLLAQRLSLKADKRMTCVTNEVTHQTYTYILCTLI